MRQVTHALLTRPPLSHYSVRKLPSASFDLHVLGTPPAFILSQDQTLVKSVCIQFRIAWQFCSCLLFLGSLQTAHETRNKVSRSFGFANTHLRICFKTSFKHPRFVRAVLSLFWIFKRIFQGCCLLFNYQGSLCCCRSRDSSFILSQAILLCQQLFSFFYFCFCPQCSHSGGCPDDKCYNITAFRNCQ